MAVIQLTPVDNTTAAVYVNSEIIYHVYTTDIGTRVFYGKSGNIPYQIDVQESASDIGTACPNLISIDTDYGVNYIFVGSGGAGDGKGIMLYNDDGNGGSKILFKYTEESTPIMIYSTNSPAEIDDKINGGPPVPMTYVSSEWSYLGGTTNPGDVDVPILRIKIVTTGSLSPLTGDDFAFTTTGTTDETNILAAKMYYTGNSSTFSTTTPYGGSYYNPYGSFDIPSSQALVEGDNYFWLTYDVASFACSSGGPDLSGTCENLLVSSATYSPTLSNSPDPVVINCP